ncbi:phosphonate C-P lyase system protein PhnH [Crocosphaera sp.]|uniref:phosphonate C-P lyase system protein PhnH n=1 Tax=Crocosphaera sp. TaxID=2729996 RepID=UPI0026101288|nr:phosphonate C-P lyase system protein PhnH [Crocosphaera sp.]MDJ0580319.1 phosphonate C-P lyase system protein PhnH [Crocosphaera sp.]
MLKINSIWQPQTQQQIFRKLLHCFSFPGEIISLKEHLGTDSILVGILATILDQSVTWNDDDNLVSQSDRLLLQSPLDSAKNAQYIVKNALNTPSENLEINLGHLSNPEKGATLILRGEAMGKGNLKLHLTGPGIANSNTIFLQGFDPNWLTLRNQWNRNFPLGVDLILVDTEQVLALPRTTIISCSCPEQEI